jgi:hypothetical protein
MVKNVAASLMKIGNEIALAVMWLVKEGDGKFTGCQMFWGKRGKGSILCTPCLM